MIENLYDLYGIDNYQYIENYYEKNLLDDIN